MVKVSLMEVLEISISEDMLMIKNLGMERFIGVMEESIKAIGLRVYLK